MIALLDISFGVGLPDFLFLLMRFVLFLSLEGFEVDREMRNIGIGFPSGFREGITFPLDIVELF